MNKILPIFLFLALMTPTLEALVLEVWSVDGREFCLSEISENESENKESEKEEKKEKEIEEFDIVEWSHTANKFELEGWLENSLYYQSWIDEIPSPPPDSRS